MTRSFRPTPEPMARLRVRRPSDFLAVVPYLLGFHPSESLVVVLSRHGRVVLTARLDLPPPPLVGAVLEQVLSLAEKHGIDELVLLAYGEDGPGAREVLQRLLDGVPGSVVVREALLVSGDRWWSLSCRTGCCPAAGTPFDPTTHPLAAEAVYAGLAAESSRAVLERQVRGPEPPDVPRLQEEVRQARGRAPLDRATAAALMAETVRAVVRGTTDADEPTCALLAVLALDLTVRDVAWALISREAVDAHLRLWSTVVARSPDEVAAAPLGLLGVAGWISGNGALLNCCVERLERLDPDYTLGLLLSDISDRALPPSLWDEMVDDLRHEVGAVAGDLRLH
ncbi:MAG: DUF4192 domain-containing protein [Friedmanniella sp.]